MGLVALPTTFVDGVIPTAAQFNGDFTAIVNEFNGNITNANISASAAIATSKINTTFPSGTIVGTTDIQTLTNKTLTSPTITTPIISQINSATSADLALIADTANGKAVTTTVKRQGGDTDNWSTNGTTEYTDSGVVIQCGSFRLGDTSQHEITFPDAFSQVPLVVCSLFNSASATLVIKARSATTFSVAAGAGADASSDCYWIAIGKR